MFKYNSNKQERNITPTELKTTSETKTNYVDNNPIKLGLYKNYRNGKNRKLITTYEETWQYHNDISSFEVYYTEEEEIPSTNQIKLFDTYQNKYQNIDKYRIGYQIEFNINDKLIKKTILSPKDTEEFYDFVKNCLEIDPKKRPNAEELIKHKFIIKYSKGNN